VSKSGEVVELSATLSCVLGASCTLSGRNAENISFLYTYTSANLVLFGVQRFVFFYGDELLL
jgi:hypothetical protein